MALARSCGGATIRSAKPGCGCRAATRRSS
jgi:hypothetical protein